jgi:hypothetical protein
VRADHRAGVGRQHFGQGPDLHRADVGQDLPRTHGRRAQPGHLGHGRGGHGQEHQVRPPGVPGQGLGGQRRIQPAHGEPGGPGAPGQQAAHASSGADEQDVTYVHNLLKHL